MALNIEQTLAAELQARPAQVQAAIRLLDEGATVPFIARYRKEATGGLDDGQLRRLEERLLYLRELEQRRTFIIEQIQAQGKLNAALRLAIEQADSKARLEDLYLPYRPKRRTKAQIACEAGLEPLAEDLLDRPEQAPEALARRFVRADRGVGNIQEALDGARQILMERFAEDAELVGTLREYLWQHGLLHAQVLTGQEDKGSKFADYFDYREPIRKIPSHRALALFRGQAQGVLSLRVQLAEESDSLSWPEQHIARHFGIRQQDRPGDVWLMQTVSWTWKVKLHTRLDLDLKMRLREQAEAAAIEVFAANLKAVLLAAPAGQKVIMGLDPGLRTGIKLCVIDETGKVLETATLYPHPPHGQWQEGLQQMAAIIQRHRVALIAIGNGTASRETEKWVQALIQAYPRLQVQSVMISEAGASVYSASELAAQELPELDVTLRGAVSIARRLQDPLAELVKIDPKSIGVGQYQHDVNQTRLARMLEHVVEDCVNHVGVDLNTASSALLKQVAGLNQTQANNIVAFRDAHGPFTSRQQLLRVPRIGPKAFEQAAGFLRIPGAKNPLDASAVHPEAYGLVESIARTHGKSVAEMIGDGAFLRRLNPADYTTADFGLPTVQDILQELEKPGRDPRPEFKTARFREGVETLEDLKPGMILEGVVSNVADFGAFVDIGVHQDGLVHVSALSSRFVKNPRTVVQAGDLVKVKVLSVDLVRRRIALSMRLDDESHSLKKPMSRKSKMPRHKSRSNLGNTLGTAFAKAFDKAKCKE